MVNSSSAFDGADFLSKAFKNRYKNVMAELDKALTIDHSRNGVDPDEKRKQVREVRRIAATAYREQDRFWMILAEEDTRALLCRGWVKA